MARPRQFDPGEALQKVKVAFWRSGYEGTSIRDIEAETGIRKQSLYRLFGDKRDMYRFALADYGQKEARTAETVLRRPGTATDRFKRLFDALVESSDTEVGRRGCFICNASIDQAQIDEHTRRSVGVMTERMRNLFEDALADTEPYRSDADLRCNKATALVVAYNGMRVMIRAGMEKEFLRNAVKSTLRSI